MSVKRHTLNFVLALVSAIALIAFASGCAGKSSEETAQRTVNIHQAV